MPVDFFALNRGEVDGGCALDGEDRKGREDQQRSGVLRPAIGIFPGRAMGECSLRLEPTRHRFAQGQ